MIRRFIYYIIYEIHVRTRYAVLEWSFSSLGGESFSPE